MVISDWLMFVPKQVYRCLVFFPFIGTWLSVRVFRRDHVTYFINSNRIRDEFQSSVQRAKDIGPRDLLFRFVGNLACDNGIVGRMLHPGASSRY